MSTTTTPTVSSTDAAIIAAIPFAASVLGGFLSGKLAGVNATIQADIASAETKADAEIDAVHAKLDAFEASSPLVQPALAGSLQVLNASGLKTWTEADLFGAAKAMVNAGLDALKTT